jgi:hypothetical protein
MTARITDRTVGRWNFIDANLKAWRSESNKEDELTASQRFYADANAAAWKTESESMSQMFRSEFVKAGESLVRPGLHDEWAAFVSDSTIEFSSAGIMDSVVCAMSALAEGATFEEASSAMYANRWGGLPEECASVVAEKVAQFYKDKSTGEAFRAYCSGLQRE